MDHEVANRGRWHIESEWLPLIAVVEGEVDGALGPGEQESSPHRILADRIYYLVAGNPADDLLPAFPSIARPIDVRVQIVELEPVDGGVSGLVIEVRRFQLRHLAP